ncbi:hypothetical protein PRVXH_000343 [Proteinivorax hydrogeniformans]|uniref:ABC exporter n=1 Tax=Proteinivorax hydrogeniformans TaxID=1826727 RepID=A0AAU8HUI1_9FIRM
MYGLIKVILKIKWRFYVANFKKVAKYLLAILIGGAIIIGNVDLLIDNKMVQENGRFILSLLITIFIFHKTVWDKKPCIYFSLPSYYYILGSSIKSSHLYLMKFALLFLSNSIISLGILAFLTFLGAFDLSEAWFRFLNLLFLMCSCQFLSLIYYSFEFKGKLLVRIISAMVLWSIFMTMDFSFLILMLLSTVLVWVFLKFNFNMNHPKFLSDCRFIYLSKKYFLEDNWAGLQTLANEAKKGKKNNKILGRRYMAGWKGLLLKEVVSFLRMKVAVWLILIVNLITITAIVKAFVPNLMLLGFVAISLSLINLFRNHYSTIFSNIDNGFILPLDFNVVFKTILIIPTIISLIFFGGYLIFLTETTRVLISLVAINWMIPTLSILTIRKPKLFIIFYIIFIGVIYLAFSLPVSYAAISVAMISTLLSVLLFKGEVLC